MTEQSKAIVVAPGAGTRVGNVEFLALSEFTPRFNLSVITMAPGREGPGAHVHEDEDDAFYVLDGELRFLVDGARSMRPPEPSFWSRRASSTRSPT